MSDLCFFLEKWSAWAPGVTKLQDWIEWAQNPIAFHDPIRAPRSAFIPPMLRRRCSQLSKMSLESTHRVLDKSELANVRTVFASRNGESQTTQVLLQALASNELLSPMAFSLSVHNTSSGIFSIAASNKNSSTAIAAGLNSFCAAFLETAGQLNHNPGESVCLCAAEEDVAEAYQEAVEFPDMPFSLSLLLHHAKAGTENLSISMSLCNSRSESKSSMPQALSFIQWLCSEKDSLEISHKDALWKFKKQKGTWAKRFGSNRQ